MPAPTTADKYSSEYFDILNLIRAKPREPIVLEFDTSRQANNFRARLNYFRKALEHDAKRHPDQETRSERRDLFIFANRLTFKVVNTAVGAQVVVLLAAQNVSDTETVARASLQRIMQERQEQDMLREAKKAAEIENPEEIKSSEEDGGASLRDMFGKL